MILDGPNSLWQIFVIHIPHPQRTLRCESQSSLKCLGCWSGTQGPAGLCDSGLHIRPGARSVPSQREAMVKSRLLSMRPILGCRRKKKLCNNPLYNLYFYRFVSFLRRIIDITCSLISAPYLEFVDLLLLKGILNICNINIYLSFYF